MITKAIAIFTAITVLFIALLEQIGTTQIPANDWTLGGVASLLLVAVVWLGRELYSTKKQEREDLVKMHNAYQEKLEQIMNKQLDKMEGFMKSNQDVVQSNSDITGRHSRLLEELLGEIKKLR